MCSAGAFRSNSLILTMNQEHHHLLLQGLSLIVAEGADVNTSIFTANISQSQTGISCSPWVFLHLCAASERFVVFMMLCPTLLIYDCLDFFILDTFPLHYDVLSLTFFGFKGQQDTFCTLCHVHCFELAN